LYTLGIYSKLFKFIRDSALRIRIFLCIRPCIGLIYNFSEIRAGGNRTTYQTCTPLSFRTRLEDGENCSRRQRQKEDETLTAKRKIKKNVGRNKKGKQEKEVRRA